MPLLLQILGGAHWLGFAAIVVGWLLGLRSRTVHPLMFWGARLQLLIGLALVAVLEMMGADVNLWAVTVKLILAVAVVALTEMALAGAKKGSPRPAFPHIAVALAVVNAVIGVWIL